MRERRWLCVCMERKVHCVEVKTAKLRAKIYWWHYHVMKYIYIFHFDECFLVTAYHNGIGTSASASVVTATAQRHCCEFYARDDDGDDEVLNWNYNVYDWTLNSGRRCIPCNHRTSQWINNGEHFQVITRYAIDSNQINIRFHTNSLQTCHDQTPEVYIVLVFILTPTSPFYSFLWTFLMNT